MTFGKILNCTQHIVTPEQRRAGIIDLGRKSKRKLSWLMTFKGEPNYKEVQKRADSIALLIHKEYGNFLDGVMIGGAHFLMSSLEQSLKKYGYEVCYPFGVKMRIEANEFSKTTRFKHQGLVWAKSLD